MLKIFVLAIMTSLLLASCGAPDTTSPVTKEAAPSVNTTAPAVEAPVTPQPDTPPAAPPAEIVPPTPSAEPVPTAPMPATPAAN